MSQPFFRVRRVKVVQIDGDKEARTARRADLFQTGTLRQRSALLTTIASDVQFAFLDVLRRRF